MTRESTGPFEDLSWAKKRTLLKPPTGVIPDVLEVLGEVKSKKKEREVPVSLWESCAVLITPTWRNSIWWKELEGMRVKWIDLGRLQEESLKAWEERNTHPPSWTASLIPTRAFSGHLERETSIDA